MTSQTDSCAAVAVLETCELLEHVLLQLRPKQMCLLRRVSKQWKSVIDKSPALRRSLFLMPIASRALMAFSMTRSREGSGIVYRITAHHSRREAAAIGDFAVHGTVNAFLCGTPQGPQPHDVSIPTIEHQAKYGVRIPLKSEAVKALRRHASMPERRMDMFLTQPPPLAAVLTITTQDGGAQSTRVYAASGIRLRDLAAAIQLHFLNDSSLALSFAIEPSSNGYCPVLFPASDDPCLARLCRPSSAGDKVWAIEELLEAILCLLPPKKAITAQRVCKRWRDVVASSPTILRSLFLKADRPRMAVRLRMNKYGDREPPPSLVAQSKQIFFTAAARITSAEIQSLPGHLVIREGVMNPYLCSKTEYCANMVRPLNTRVTFADQVQSLYLNADALNACVMAPEHDRRMDMFLTQPPYDRIYVSIVDFSSHYEENIFSNWVSRLGGVRLRDIVEQARLTNYDFPRSMRTTMVLDSKHTEGGFNLIYLRDRDVATLDNREAKEAITTAKAEREAAELAAKVAKALSEGDGDGQ